jgi:hypothetical protein
MAEQSRPFQPIFVAGAPRTGTTLLHALICTSPDVNDYIAECSYFSALLNPYIAALDTFDVHTKFYFDSKHALRDFHASILEIALKKIWTRTFEPKILALKDPVLTDNLHVLADLIPDARFAVTVRDPRDATLSVVMGLRRMNSNSTDTERLRVACDQYNRMYGAVLANKATFGDRLIFVEYNSLVRGGELEKLSALGISSIRPDELWVSRTTDLRGSGVDDPWWSPLYGKDMSTAAIGRYAGSLGRDQVDLIRGACADTAARLGMSLDWAA